MTGVKTYPDWAPRLLCKNMQDGEYDYNPELVDLVIRLLTYPEMELVWASYRRWMAELYPAVFEKNLKLPDEVRLYTAERFGSDGLIEVAIKSIEKPNKTAMIPRKKREQALARVIKHAKLLRQSIEGLGMPDNIFFYYPWNTFLEIIRTSTLELYEHATDEKAFASQADMDYYLDCFIPYARAESALALEKPTGLSLRDLLTTIADEEWLNLHLPNTLVQKSKGGNEARLFIIRECAIHLAGMFKRNPLQNREFIANFVRTVLDDSEINEDVVKDALRGQERLLQTLRERSRPGE